MFRCADVGGRSDAHWMVGVRGKGGGGLAPIELGQEALELAVQSRRKAVAILRLVFASFVHVSKLASHQGSGSRWPFKLHPVAQCKKGVSAPVPLLRFCYRFPQTRKVTARDISGSPPVCLVQRVHFALRSAVCQRLPAARSLPAQSEGQFTAVASFATPCCPIHPRAFTALPIWASTACIQTVQTVRRDGTWLQQQTGHAASFAVHSPFSHHANHPNHRILPLSAHVTSCPTGTARVARTLTTRPM